MQRGVLLGVARCGAHTADGKTGRRRVQGRQRAKHPKCGARPHSLKPVSASGGSRADRLAPPASLRTPVVHRGTRVRPAPRGKGGRRRKEKKRRNANGKNRYTGTSGGNEREGGINSHGEKKATGRRKARGHRNPRGWFSGGN
eukprot:scaffold31599_cov101-Isochrysis_galbana.AAC.4